MKFYTYGEKEKPVMLLLPGTCCHHATFENVVPLLQEHFYTIVASYDGFDETEPDVIFPDMITETEKIEEYIEQDFGGRIFAAYGCSLGGSFVGLLIQRKNIHIDHGFIGSSDLDQTSIASAKAQSAIIVPIFHKMLVTGKLPGFLKKRIDKLNGPEQEYITSFLKYFGIGDGALTLDFINKKSVYNQFYSDLITPLEDDIDVEGTTIHVFYALKMGEEYENRYRVHFAHPDIRRHDLQHEELLVRLPEEWLKEILNCCGMDQEKLSDELQGTEAKTDYKNWVPDGMIKGLAAGTGLSAGALALAASSKSRAKAPLMAVTGASALGLAASTAWSVFASKKFSYTGNRKLSAQIVEGVASYVQICPGGTGLDVGCGSGALTIACAKKNPEAKMVGLDRWGAEYASFSKGLCKKNAAAEGVDSVSFIQGDAVKLDFEDETFDAVTSNYVYHNIPSRDRQALLLETLRVLKKGGTFAIHDIMTKSRYGDMDQFVQKLKDMGYEEVQLIDTSKGMFMESGEATLLGLTGSMLLTGRK